VGGFGIVGQTPPTGGSYGSFASGPTPQQHQQIGADAYTTYAPPHGSVIHRPVVAGSEAGGMRVGGLHGNTRLLPTPVVRRGGEYHQPIQLQQQQQPQDRMQPAPSPGTQYYASQMQSEAKRGSSQRKQHQQSQQSLQQKKLDPLVEGVEEDEDPAMLRYESRPGMDASPMVATSKDPHHHVGVGVGVGVDARMQEVEKAASEEATRAPSRPGGAGSSDHDTRSDKSSSLATSGGHTHRATLPSLPSYQQQAAGILNEFPFFFDGYAAWICQHCHHIPPYYRGVNYLWQSSQPPPNSFVDSHLRVCRGLNPIQPPLTQPAYAGGGMHMSHEVADSSFRYPVQQPQAPYPYAQTIIEQPLSHQQPSLSQQSYETSLPPSQHQGDAPDPPGVRSPIPITKPQGIKRGREQKMSSGVMPPQGSHWDFPPGGSGSRPSSIHDSQPPPYPYHPSQMMQMPPPAAVSAGSSYPPYMQVPAVHHHGAVMEESPPRAIKKRKTTSCKTSPKGRQSDDDTYKSSITFLTKLASDKAKSFVTADSDVGQYLIDSQDANLLTDYFFHIMQQLVICRFSEKDRKTRGGKRENVDIGYGGLQCIHCINTQTSRKFFWSTVDRLANSFAEIPSHILKCKHCPDAVRDALLVLKGRHHDQIQTLPRGSQKVFFRRVWRRLHDNAGMQAATPVRDTRLAPLNKTSTMDPPMSALVAFAETALMSPDVAVSASNRLLASAAKSLEIQTIKSGNPEEKCERVLLAIPDDKNWLSDNDCFVRNNIEVFTANQSDVEKAAADKKYPIKLGQVGIRCIHCAMASGGANCGAVSYPYSISGIYESVREFQRLHLVNCQHIPLDVKVRSEKLMGGSSSLSSVLRRYYVQAARALGLFDTQDDGIRAGGKPIPLPTSGFFQTPYSSDTRPTTTSNDAPGTVLGEDRKGGADDEKGPTDAPGSEVQRDAPDKYYVPGIEDAPGEKATCKEDAPGIGEDSTVVEQV
ncbi:hypothetical protein ACHAXH_002086, partial [Discostella pseudostelligera]